MIGTLLAPYEPYFWAAAVIGLLALGVHIEGIGEAKVKAADAAAVTMALQLRAKVEADAQNTLDPANSQLRVALDSPSIVGAVTLRVCPSTPTLSPSTVPADGSPVTGRDSGAGPLRGTVAELSESTGVDVGPTTEQLLAKADAEIAYWRAYYADCVKQNICKKIGDYHAN